jgi:hypothetical protein
MTYRENNKPRTTPIFVEDKASRLILIQTFITSTIYTNRWWTINYGLDPRPRSVLFPR